MRLLRAWLTVTLVTTLRSDISKVYAPGKEPGLVAGTAASDAAGAGTPEKPASPKAHVGNANLAQVRDITR